jgi:hypothetical protein
VKPIAAVASAVAGAAAACVVLAANPPAYAMSEQLPPGGPTASSAPSTSVPATSSPPTPAHPSCPTTARRFAPVAVSIPGVVRRAVAVAPPRVNGVPGAPPLTSAGKWQVAWDRKWPVRPGDRHGNVLLNAHVWPDGSALGNRMLARLKLGDRIVVRGKDRILCYRITKRIDVYPREALRRYYRNDGRPRVAIVVCSGRRLGPGRWEKRTIWFAAPKA